MLDGVCLKSKLVAFTQTFLENIAIWHRVITSHLLAGSGRKYYIIGITARIFNKDVVGAPDWTCRKKAQNEV